MPEKYLAGAVKVNCVRNQTQLIPHQSSVGDGLSELNKKNLRQSHPTRT